MTMKFLRGVLVGEKDIYYWKCNSCGHRVKNHHAPLPIRWITIDSEKGIHVCSVVCADEFRHKKTNIKRALSC
jgi:hypothetical protein